jgi:hypothetical protein
MHPTTRTLILPLLAALALLPPAALAKGGNGRDVRVAGSCSKGSSAKLKLSPENGRIEIEFEVDQNRNGVRWTVRLANGRSTIASTRATTRAPSGSFTVRRVTADRPGRDLISALATGPSGASCRARASL